VLEQNVPEITVAYETGWNRLTEKYYAKQEWPEAEVIAPLVGDGIYSAGLQRHPLTFGSVDPIFLILYRELYYRYVNSSRFFVLALTAQSPYSHVYSRLSPDIDDRFHSYENSCELFNYLLSTT
jgi:translation initiation factor 3 subunit L